MIAWGSTAPDEIFAPNENADVYSSVVEVLGPWQGLPHRRAAMLEVMRVLAGFESSWDWNAGVDTTNPTSITPDTIEAGAWQVSANSMVFGPELKDLVRNKVGSLDGNDFQKAMKRDHPLAMEYIARLLRRTVKANGPVKGHKIDAWLRKDAVAEFQSLLNASPMAAALAFESAAAGIPELKAVPAAAGLHGFDTNTKLTATTAKALRQAGFTFAIRYLSRKANPSARDLTADELNVILDANLAVTAVQHVAPAGWTPSDTLGVEIGSNAASHARAIGLPDNSSVWLDLEGVEDGTSADTVSLPTAMPGSRRSRPQVTPRASTSAPTANYPEKTSTCASRPNITGSPAATYPTFRTAGIAWCSTSSRETRSVGLRLTAT
jgi:hypothetical protein